MKKQLTIFLFLITLQYSNAQESSCSDLIQYEYDKFENRHSYITKLLWSDGYAFHDQVYISFAKSFRTAAAGIYIYVSIDVRSPDYRVKGATFLFTNGKKITKPAQEIDCDYSSTTNNWSFNAYILLSTKDLETFRTENLTDVRLGYRSVEDLKETDVVKDVITCMIKASIPK